MSECPTCGKEYVSKRAVGIHHAQAHGESLAFQTYNCDTCGCEFEKQATKVTGDSHYCSRDCQSEAKKISFTKRRLYTEYWNHKQSAYEIADKLGVSHNTIQRRMRDYGIPRIAEARSHDAWIFAQRPVEWYKQEYHNKRKSTYTIAEENNVTQEWVRKLFQEQGVKMRNEWITHKKNKNELARIEYDYGSDWQDIRQQVLERDGHTCQGCARDNSEVSTPLHVHHIKGVREFLDSDIANKHSNLVTLCIACHNRWENVPVRPKTL